jgi:hypothetical protein
MLDGDQVMGAALVEVLRVLALGVQRVGRDQGLAEVACLHKLARIAERQAQQAHASGRG